MIIGVLTLLLVAAGPGGAQSPPGDVWTERIHVDSGGGYQGPWRMNESEWDYLDAPTVAAAGDGTTVVAWVDQARKEVLLQRFGPDGEPELEGPSDVSGSPDVFSWLPRIVVSPEDPDRIHVLWQEIVFSGGSHGGEIFFARSTDGGASFEEPLNLSNTPAGAGKGRLTPRYWHNGSLDLVRGDDGTLYAAWTEYEGALRVARSTDDGAGFSDPVRVAGEDPPARGPSLAVTREGVVHVAWTVGGDPGADLRLATSRDRGRSFSGPRVLYPGDGHADAPKIAADGEGSVHLVWADAPDGPSGAYRVRYARSGAGERPFGADEAPPRVLSTTSDEFESASFPGLAVGPGGAVAVIWELYPDRRRRPRGLGFARSDDGGTSFGSPSVVPGTADPDVGVNGSLQGLLMRKLALDDAGRLALVHPTFREHEASHVWLLRGRLPGR